VKVWIFKGEIMEHDPMAQDKRLNEAAESASRGTGRQAAE
jgi:small subunit ribosomal protein S3